MNLYLGQQPIPEHRGGREGERPGQLIIGSLQGGLTHRRPRSHIISRPPGLHVGGLRVENRRPGEEPTQAGGEHVNFTQQGSRLICEPWTCSAVKVYLATGRTKSVSLHLLFITRSHCFRTASP